MKIVTNKITSFSKVYLSKKKKKDLFSSYYVFTCLLIYNKG